MAALLLHHLLLVAACASLAWAGWSVAGLLGAWGVERGLSAVVLAAAAAGLSALLLGLVGAGGSPWALAGVALALGVLPRATAAARRGADERRADRPQGRSTRRSWPGGVLVGVGLVWFAWLARHPALGIDPLTYHLPESIAWVQGGHPGRGEEVVYEFPIQAYPLTNELLLGWAMGIGRSFAPALAWTPLAAVLFAVASWDGMARLGVRRAPAALAIAAVLLMPIAVRQLHGPHTDLPALAWLATCWALTLAARQRTALLIPALLAGGLAIGTKTTTAPYVAGVLAYAAYRHRTALHAHARGLLLAAAAAVAVGGLWYVRNLIDHGSPLWPFVPLGGDPAPPLFEQIDSAFIERPADTLRGRTGAYIDALGGPLLLLPIAAGLAVAKRRARVAAGVAVAGVVVWMNAPFTGRADDPVVDLSISTLRYLLPALAAATLATALALRDHRRAGVAVLGGAVLASAVHTSDIPFPGSPSLLLLTAGAAAGAALCVANVPKGLVLTGCLGRSVLAAAAVVALTLAADGLPERHATTGAEANRGVLRFIAAQDASDVHFAPSMLGTAAGERLQRELHFIPRDEPCEKTIARKGYVVLGTPPFADRRASFNAMECLGATDPAFKDDLWTVYAR